MTLPDNENDVAESDAFRRKVCLGLACLMVLVFLGQAVSSASGPRAWDDRQGHLLVYVAISLTVVLAVYVGWDIGLLGMLVASGIGASFKIVHIDHLASTTVCAFVGLAGGLIVGAILRGSTATASELRNSLVPSQEPISISTLPPHVDRLWHRPLGCFTFAVLLFATSNFLLLPIESILLGGTVQEFAMYVCIAAIGAQASLHAIWFVLAPVAATTRLATGLTGILVLFAAWAFGYATVYRGFPSWIYSRNWTYYWDSVLTGLACLPLLALAVQTPLWMARAWDGWRIVHRDEIHLAPRFEPLRIRHILTATGAVAIALALVRLGRPEGVSSDAGFLNGLLIAAAVAAVTSLLTTLPLTVATLRRRRLCLALPATMLHGVVTVAGLIALLSVLNQSAPPSDAYYQTSYVVASFYVTTGGVLLVARRLGYRLLRRRDAHTDGLAKVQPREPFENDRPR